MAAEQGDNDYVCQLDSLSRKKARDELNEIESDRACAVQVFRKWALEQEPWLTCPTDFKFLLRFLRVRKYSQVGARLSLEKYMTNITQLPEWFTDVDPADPKIQSVLRSGFYFASTRLDSQNRRILIHRLGAIDDDLLKDESSLVTVFRALCLVAHWFSSDENVQVNGIKALVDWSGITLQHLTTLYKVENVKKVVNFLENSLPVRMKGIVMYNESPFFDVIYAMISPFMKEKTKKRASFNGKNLVNVYTKIDQSLLPREYLPDDYEGPCAGSVREVCDAMIEDMMRPEFRAYIKYLSSSNYKVDLNKKPKMDNAPESYRKFNMD